MGNQDSGIANPVKGGKSGAVSSRYVVVIVPKLSACGRATNVQEHGGQTHTSEMKRSLEAVAGRLIGWSSHYFASIRLSPVRFCAISCSPQ